MAQREVLKFTDEDRQQLAHDRYHFPHPRVQQRMEVLWLLSQGESQQRAAKLAGVGRTTAYRYVEAFRQGGIAALRALNWEGPDSALAEHRDTLAAEFRERPPHTVAEAAARIEELTGVRRQPTQTRQFLRSLGLSWRRVAALPTPPKKRWPNTPEIKLSSCAENWSLA